MTDQEQSQRAALARTTYEHYISLCRKGIIEGGKCFCGVHESKGTHPAGVEKLNDLETTRINMPCTLNADAYRKLFDEDIAWVLQQPRTLESEHVVNCLKWMRDNKRHVETDPQELSKLRSQLAAAGELCSDRHPPRHAKYIVERDGHLFTATPCYGLHDPWWVVRTMATSWPNEAEPVAMVETDRWWPIATFLDAVGTGKAHPAPAEPPPDEPIVQTSIADGLPVMALGPPPAETLSAAKLEELSAREAASDEVSEEPPVREKCRECGGTGLDHPASAKYRNTDDDTCPVCKGTGWLRKMADAEDAVPSVAVNSEAPCTYCGGDHWRPDCLELGIAELSARNKRLGGWIKELCEAAGIPRDSSCDFLLGTVGALKANSDQWKASTARTEPSASQAEQNRLQKVAELRIEDSPLTVQQLLAVMDLAQIRSALGEPLDAPVERLVERIEELKDATRRHGLGPQREIEQLQAEINTQSDEIVSIAKAAGLNTGSISVQEIVEAIEQLKDGQGASPEWVLEHERLGAEVASLNKELEQYKTQVALHRAELIATANREAARAIEVSQALWQKERAELQAEVARLQAIIDTHDLCHNQHGKVDARAFADGCAAEQRKLYGCAPDADEVARLSGTREKLWSLQESHVKATAEVEGLRKLVSSQAAVISLRDHELTRIAEAVGLSAGALLADVIEAIELLQTQLAARDKLAADGSLAAAERIISEMMGWQAEKSRLESEFAQSAENASVLVKEIQRLEKEVARLQTHYPWESITQPPDRPGWWWFEEPSDLPQIVDVQLIDDGTRLAFWGTDECWRYVDEIVGAEWSDRPVNEPGKKE